MNESRMYWHASAFQRLPGARDCALGSAKLLRWRDNFWNHLFYMKFRQPLLGVCAPIHFPWRVKCHQHPPTKFALFGHASLRCQGNGNPFPKAGGRFMVPDIIRCFARGNAGSRRHGRIALGLGLTILGTHCDARAAEPGSPATIIEASPDVSIGGMSGSRAP